MLLGGALRFADLDAHSLWNDELATWQEARHDTPAELIRESFTTNQLPLHLLLVRQSLREYGVSEEALRYPAAFTGLLAVPLLFLLGRRLYRDDLIALLAAAFMAVMWAAVDISREARGYATLITAVTLAMTGWVELVRAARQGRLPSILSLSALVAGNLAACYTHYYGVLFAGLQGVVSLGLALRSGAALWRVVLAWTPVALGLLPLLRALLRNVVDAANAGLTAWIPAPGVTDVLKVPVHFFGRSPLVIPLAAVIALYALWRLLRRPGPTRRRPLLLLPFRLHQGDLIVLGWLVLPALVAFVWSHAGNPVFHYRPLLILLPAAFLLLARLVRIAGGGQAQGMVIGAVVVLVCLLDLFLVKQYYRTPQREQFRGASEFVIRNTAPGSDPFIVARSYGHPPYFSDYFRLLGAPLRADAALARPTRSRWASLLDSLDGAATPPDSLWLLYGHVVPDPWERDSLRAHGYRSGPSTGLIMAGATLYLRKAPNVTD